MRMQTACKCFSMGPPGCREALWVLVRLPISRRFANFGHRKVHKYLEP